MSYRVQFTVSDDELAELKSAAQKEGYPSVAALCYARSLPHSETREMFEELVKSVSERQTEEPFVIRDMFPNRRIPAVLGRFFAEAVDNGSVKNVVALGRNKTRGADEYKKIIKSSD